MMLQQDLFESEAARSLLDQLLDDARLYHSSTGYRELLDFVVKLRNFAPFNAMLLHIQKPGLSYAASAFDWRERFNRRPKRDARPLLILWPFGPVAFVYDVQDTEGDDLPKDVSFFQASGEITEERMKRFLVLMERKRIKYQFFDGGEHSAGSIEVTQKPPTKADKKKKAGKPSEYLMRINQNHAPNVQFSTLAHELGHLFLGHLGPDERLSIPERPKMTNAQVELEAESFAYLACRRNGVSCKSQSYLANYVDKHTKVDNLDIYQIVRAVGQMETLLELTAHTRYEVPTA
ncbi:ImmA/IrrE family metallo-endopeptidase [Metapseudomonas boanensis]|uniref:ImmA/IrrE family metallo-endopeptidase n=1 Tax=Metapseudomonas boanensis TaxID=2822138 RepID=A0ABS5XP60_9GAMM|nr:ImmA/IrrE family metallo-endopeptidase [Pseudomonas boanensis]MBT8768062.1 ImmA/IrrE family metallo-endopeptidase [Pseudomonas boanensis]